MSKKSMYGGEYCSVAKKELGDKPRKYTFSAMPPEDYFLYLNDHEERCEHTFNKKTRTCTCCGARA